MREGKSQDNFKAIKRRQQLSLVHDVVLEAVEHGNFCPSLHYVVFNNCWRRKTGKFRFGEQLVTSIASIKT